MKQNLYHKGTWDETIFAKCIAIVGSRRMTEYGRRVVEKIVPNLVQQGYTIVSGFMYGVDQTAHQVCVDCGGRTIAVLGWGINEPLADSDLQLANRIIENKGLLVSLWEDQKGTLWTFPTRNKVVAEISQEVIVVEAGLKSGSLITANLALKMNKKVWAVPGPITSLVSMGTNMLIKNGLAEMFAGAIHESPLPNVATNPILNIIVNEGLDAAEIARKLDQPISKIATDLTMLVLSGEVEERSGKYFIPV